MQFQARCSAGTGRQAFTLVELLVVIVIITILIGLLIPVIGMATATVNEATMTAEVATISNSLEAFKTQYQNNYPPDFSGRVVLAGPRQLVGLDADVVDDYMSRTHRYRNSLTDIPRDPNGAALGREWFNNLDPSEALVLWLRGFSDDQANPLFGTPGLRPEDVPRTALFDFDEARLRDTDGDYFMEYYPRAAREMPYVYLVHYNYIGAFQEPTFRCRTSSVSTSAAIPCPRPYLLTRRDASGQLIVQQQKYNRNVMLFEDVNNFAESKKFQVICAGLDNNFGVQVTSDPSNPLTFFGAYTYVDGPYPEKQHLDNITNFAEGSLEDAMP